MKSLNQSIFLYVQINNYSIINNIIMERKNTMVELKICDIKRENNTQVYHAYLELLLSNTFVFGVWVYNLDVD